MVVVVIALSERRAADHKPIFELRLGPTPIAHVESLEIVQRLTL
jgi:hypothetical protein